MPKIQTTLNITFDEDFLKKHAGRIIEDPNFAIVELITNSWDAGASKVEITYPFVINEEISILDNGSGMEKEELIKKWNTLNYNRVKNEGKYVLLPDGKKSNRRVYGRNGKGRHAMFCFNDSYFVSTWKSGIKNNFQIKMSDGAFEVVFKDSETVEKNKSGTRIFTKAKRNLIDISNIKLLIGSKFTF